MKKRFLFALSLLLCALMLAGCASNTAEDQAAASAAADVAASVESAVDAAQSALDEAVDSVVSSEAEGPSVTTTLADIQEKGKLVIGLDDTFAPMGFREADGTLVGFDIDLATAVCGVLGVEAEFQPIDWNAKEMELNTGNIDCIWNGMSATPERQESMSLSQNYLNNKIIVLTNEGVTINSKEELVGLNIGVQGGSAAEEAVVNDPIYSEIEDTVTPYPTYDEVILDMNAGRIDCVVIDEVFGNYKNSKLDKPFGTAGVDFGDDFYAIGFRKGDTELTEAVNDAINQLVADGTAAEISNKWFGADLVLKAEGGDEAGSEAASDASSAAAPDASSEAA